jgi:CRP-like cAMP-binding protein
MYFRQGDRANEAYVLMRGGVKLVKAGSGRRDILRFVSPLEPFGHEAALGGTVYAASAQASEDSEALAWPAAVLTRMMAKHPMIAHNSLRIMAERIQGASERFHGLLAESLERRTARALLMLGARLGRTVEGGTAIEIRLLRQDLAAFVGSTPYAMRRLVSRWRRLRIVDAGRGWVVIRPRRLATMIGDRGLPRGQR